MPVPYQYEVQPIVSAENNDVCNSADEKENIIGQRGSRNNSYCLFYLYHFVKLDLKRLLLVDVAGEQSFDEHHYKS